MPPNMNGAPPTNTVVKQPLADMSGPLGDYVMFFATVADDIPAWGVAPRDRDAKLREFWPTEPILASVIYTTIARYAAFGYTLNGPDRMVSIVQRQVDGLEWGKGWQVWLTKILLDLFTQDNGAFSEIVRTADSPSAPFVTLKHLDAARCIRTGRAEEPVIYFDWMGVAHILKWYQVATIEEFPSPIEHMRGMQYCAVTRMLKAAQVMRDIQLYKREKISGRNPKSIHFVSGVQHKTIQDVLGQKRLEDDAQGLMRFALPAIIASLDPTKQVSVATIDMAGMPDNWNEEVELKWYINQAALAFGADYQDYAPLPGGNLGSAQQSETLHLKSRGKGPRLFMTMMENILNTRVFPSSVQLKFGDQDVSEDMQHSRLRMNRATQLSTLIAAGVIDGAIARQISNDDGDLKDEYLAKLGDKDLTPDRDETKEPADE